MMNLRRSAVLELGACIAQSIGASPSLRLSPLQQSAPNGSVDDEEMALTTIFPFTIEREGRSFTPDECRDIYRELARDARDVVAANRAGAGEIAAQVCLVGQPVELGGRDGTATAALRICIDARCVTETWSPDANVARRNLKHELGRAAAVVAKIELLLGHADQRNIQTRAHGH